MDFTNSCRTCMRSNVVLIKLHDSIKFENGVQLDEALMECTSAQVQREDGLPQGVCAKCVDQIQASYKFRLQVLASENEFKNLMFEVPIKNEERAEFALDFPSQFKQENDDDVDSFDHYDDLSKDESDLLDEKPYHCSECQENVFDINMFLLHVMSHNPNFCCLFCNKNFKYQYSLDKHSTNEHYVVSCEECRKGFKSNELFTKHVLTHVPSTKQEILKQELFPCTKCDRTFTNGRSRAMHMKKHKYPENEKQMFICDTCNKEFPRRYALIRHLETHEKKVTYDCKLCPKTYERKCHYLKHMQFHKGGKVNVCPFCSREFTQLCSLKDHIRTHTGETPYLCSQCGSSFKNSSNLRQHIMRHASVKSFQCAVCPKMFTSKIQRDRHLRTHTGAKPYLCPQCGTGFTSPTALKKHKLIHLGLRPFACESCSMTFRAKDHLTRHARVHTHERPHRCTYCPRTFKQVNDLRKHLRVHIGANTYECTVCHMKFRLNRELKDHYPLHYINGDPPIIEVKKGVELPVLVNKMVTSDVNLSIKIDPQ